MPAVWPASLPQKMLAPGFDEQPPDERIRTPMEVGPAKLRRRTSAGVRPIKGSIRCSLTQRATFDEFYRSTLSGGVLPFDWVHPVTQTAATFRFVEVPRYAMRTANLVEIALSLELMP